MGALRSERLYSGLHRSRERGIPFMKWSKAIFLVLLLPVLPVAAGSSNPGQDALMEMGRLNGVALACRYYEQTRRIKQALIDNLPKRRELGQLFDDRTNESFMAFVNSGEPCPSPAEFETGVERAIRWIEQAFEGQSL